jgi:hypothetical protein
MDVEVPEVVLGFLGTAVVLGLLAFFVGVDDLLTAFGLLDARSMVLVAGAGIGWLVAWSLALERVLRTLGLPVSRFHSVLLYASAAFANNVTPFGQAGGEPFSALLISRSTNTEYERGLAAIASVDSLNFVPSIVLALLGLTYYAARFTVGDRLQVVIGVVIGLAIVVPTGIYLLWRYRSRLNLTVARLATPVLRRIAAVVPGIESPDPMHIRERIANFYGAIGRVSTGGGDLAIALAFSALGWLFLSVALWLSLWALGYTVSPPIVLIIVPVSTIASVAPLPGGAGGVEAVTVLLLVPTTGVSPATAGAAAIVYRVATYWLSTVLGGIAVAWLQGRSSA